MIISNLITRKSSPVLIWSWTWHQMIVIQFCDKTFVPKWKFTEMSKLWQRSIQLQFVFWKFNERNGIGELIYPNFQGQCQTWYRSVFNQNHDTNKYLIKIRNTGLQFLKTRIKNATEFRFLTSTGNSSSRFVEFGRWWNDKLRWNWFEVSSWRQNLWMYWVSSCL